MSTQKQQYYYDYNQTASTPDSTPNVQSTSTTSSSVPPSQDVLSQTPPPAPEVGEYSNDDGIKKSNFLPIVLGILAIIVIVVLVWAILPKDYNSCVNFPGSNVSNIDSASCRTFYGTTYSANPNQDIEDINDSTDNTNEISQDNGASGQDGTNPIPSPINPNTGSSDATAQPIPTTIPTATPNDNPTTKGNQPLPTPTPTSKPQTTTNPPQNLNGSGESQTFQAPIDWTKHNYPNQHFTIYMPKNFQPSNATRNLTTNITTITTNKTGFAHNPAIHLAIQPNWGNYETVKNNNISFMIDGSTGVIKEEVDTNTTRYFFVRGNQIWVYTCNHHGDGTLKNECDQILKSIKFT